MVGRGSMSQRYRDVLDYEEGMRAAITTVRTGYKEMIEAWRAT